MQEMVVPLGLLWQEHLKQMVIQWHGFTDRFIATVQENVELDAEQVIAASGLLRFLHSEMKAASRGAKARKNLANHSAKIITIVFMFYLLVSRRHGWHSKAKFQNELDTQENTEVFCLLQQKNIHSGQGLDTCSKNTLIYSPMILKW